MSCSSYCTSLGGLILWWKKILENLSNEWYVNGDGEIINQVLCNWIEPEHYDKLTNDQMLQNVPNYGYLRVIVEYWNVMQFICRGCTYVGIEYGHRSINYPAICDITNIYVLSTGLQLLINHEYESINVIFVKRCYVNNFVKNFIDSKAYVNFEKTWWF